jgi:hypothetical protein
MRHRTRTRVVAVLAAASVVAVGDEAYAYCRTTACPLPADFSPSAASCTPNDFDSYCASLSPPAKPIPVWWRNACVSYDIQQTASKQVPYAAAVTMFEQAFAKWTSTMCPEPSVDVVADGGVGMGSGRVSIDVRNLGAVSCGEVQYNSDAPNQHVIIFHDDHWPHNDSSNTLGLTTVTYDPDTGEIYDADMEINSTVPLSLGDPVPQAGYDFQSIITHECGHFLGMAHSGQDRATMYAHYTQGTTYMRDLTSDDVSGLCSIYLPNGNRVVDPSTTSGGGNLVTEDSCDPTPRHGFSAQCASNPSSSLLKCAVAGSAPGGRTNLGALAGLLGMAALAAARRVRRAR